MIQLWSLECWHFLGLRATICVEESVSAAPPTGHTRIYTNPGRSLRCATPLLSLALMTATLLMTRCVMSPPSCSRGQQGVWWHHILFKGTKGDDVTSFWRQQDPAAARRTLVGPQGCTASSAASLCTHRRDNAEDKPSCNLATREGNELQVFHLEWASER